MLDQGPLVGFSELTQAAAIEGCWYGAPLSQVIES